MLLAFCLVLLSFILSVNLFISRVREEKKEREVRKYFPGPLHLPWIGALFQFAYLKIKVRNLAHHERAHALCQMYGKTACGWAGGLSLLLTEDIEVAKEIFHSPDFGARFTAHPRFRELTFNKNLGLFIASDEPWKVMRKYSIRALRRYGFGEAKAAEVFIDEELAHFFIKLDQDRARNGNEIYVRKYFKVCLFNSIWRVMSGERFDYSDPRIHRLTEDVEKGTDMEIGFNVEWVFPSLRYVPGFSTCWQHCKALIRVQDFLKDLMDKRRASGSYKKNPPDNFIDHFLQTLDKEQAENPDTHFTDLQFIQTCCDLLCASIDTTSNTAEFATLYLLRNPHVLAKVRAEIDVVVGSDRLPAVHEDAKRMPYMRAFMLEVFRHANLLPLMGRSNTSDAIVKGHFVPANVQVGINLAFIHMDPEVWGDPDNFRPERFLDEQMNIINEDKILAFGEGKRTCIGTAMAKVVMFKIMTALLQRYDITRSPLHPELCPKAITGLTNGVTPFYCLITSRERKSDQKEVSVRPA